ncbi:PRC-barrel domain-containing protein [Solirhodobacter olei]|uniref:PRC-barrel domain-containing protein n=1 Tax=Solirhodobacter olei TaxID=2493082 RepID=UPI000FD71998|nr:PRC-barrel domain-containing protein [Solirhodobacter olei]
MKSLMISTLLVAATGLGAAAQTTGSAAAPTAGKAPSSAAGTTTGANAKAGFLTSVDPSELQASKLIGTKVYSTGGQQAPQQVKAVPKAWKDVGSVGDLMLNRQGQVKAVVINVGGFLGIGDHRVALNLSGLKFVKKPNSANPNGFVLAVDQSPSAMKAAPAFQTPAEQMQKQQALKHQTGTGGAMGTSGGTSGSGTAGGGITN